MIKKFIAWIKGEVKTVESIMSDFYSKVRELEHHAASMFEQAEQHAQNAAESLKSEAEAKAEALKATTAAQKIGALIK